MQMSQTLDSLQREIASVIQERQLTVERRDFEGSKQWIYYDPVRIKQALQNIVHNAIKYTPNGGRITIDGRLLPGFLEVTIADTGIGIAIGARGITLKRQD
jgi:signal transduction histidine kinase